MDKLFTERKIFVKDIEHVYEGMFLKAVTTFEGYLENMFIGLLSDKYHLPTRKKLAKFSFKDKAVATDIVYFNQNYVDWMPFEKLNKRSHLFFHEGKPFSDLGPSEKAVLTQIFSIRNAIAHKSSYSNTKFVNQVVKTTPSLPIAHRTPAGYLRYNFRTSPRQTKFEIYLIELIGIAHKFSSYN